MNQQLNKRILITGANGFIGSKLTYKLVSLGFKPFVLVRDKNRIQPLTEIKNKISISEADITNFDQLRKITTDINPQVVFHLAAFGVYTYSDMNIQNIKSIVDSNVYGTLNLLYALKDLNCELLINTGSCFEYGSKEKAFEENDRLEPANIYGVTKVASTKIAHQLAYDFKIRILTLRPFSVYGPGENSKRFMSTIISNCLNNLDIKLPKIDITRDFIYVDDVVSGYLAVLEKNDLIDIPIINLSTGKGKTLEEVVLIIKSMVDSKSQIKKGEFKLRSGEVLSLIGDNKSAEISLDWQPKYSIKEGLNKMLALNENR